MSYEQKIHIFPNNVHFVFTVEFGWKEKVFAPFSQVSHPRVDRHEEEKAASTQTFQETEGSEGSQTLNQTKTSIHV